MKISKNLENLINSKINKNVAQKLKNIEFVIGKDIDDSAELVDYVFAAIASSDFFEIFNFEIDEDIRNVEVHIRKSMALDLTRAYGKHVVFESLSYEYYSEFTRKLLIDLLQYAQHSETLSVNKIESHMIKYFSDDHYYIVSPLVATFLYSFNFLKKESWNDAKDTEILRPTSRRNIFVNAYATDNSIVKFDPREFTVNLTNIAIFKHLDMHNVADYDPETLRIEGGVTIMPNKSSIHVQKIDIPKLSA